MSQLLVQPMLDQLPHYIQYAIGHSIRFELLSFEYPDTPTNKRNFEHHLSLFTSESCKKLLYSMHCASMGVDVTSADKQLRLLSQKKIRHNCEVATQLGIQNLIVHSHFSPSICDSEYIKRWMELSQEFYTQLLSQYDVTFLMENCDDVTPEYIKRLIDSFHTPRFKACLDVGHANCNSPLSVSEWVSVLGEDLVYCHFSDNDGWNDQHRPIGSGTADYASFTRSVLRQGLHPAVVLEVFTLPEIMQSIAYLKEHRYYPFEDIQVR